MKKSILILAVFLFSIATANAQMAAQFTTKVENREPVDKIDSIQKDSGAENIVFYSVLQDLDGQAVTHVWKNGDEEVYSRTFNVGAPRWRAWSSVMVDHFEAGDTVSVEIKDQEGKVLQTETLEIK